MEFKKLSLGERLALRHLCWPQYGTDLPAVDPALFQLEEKGLVFRSSTGEWKPTAHGRFWYACVAIGLEKPL
jgi:hypothetical protein